MGLAHGQTSWLRSVIGGYEAKLLRYAADIVGPGLARDVVQDTFLKLCREPREHVESHLSAWLFTVCRNSALEIKRKVRRLSPLDEQCHEAADHSPGSALEQHQLLARVQGCMARLPERQRELLRLKFDGELSYKEIAEVTGLSVSNVGFILHTALASVRLALEQDEQRSAASVKRGKR